MASGGGEQGDDEQQTGPGMTAVTACMTAYMEHGEDEQQTGQGTQLSPRVHFSCLVEVIQAIIYFSVI